MSEVHDLGIVVYTIYDQTIYYRVFGQAGSLIAPHNVRIHSEGFATIQEGDKTYKVMYRNGKWAILGDTPVLTQTYSVDED